MNLTFFKKEILAVIKTNKLLVLPLLMLLFAIMSPLTAKFTNEIIKSLPQSGGVIIEFPEPTIFDSYIQFFKNSYTIIPIFIILVFMGSVSEEKMKGTIHIVLTKNLKRYEFLISKLIANYFLFLFSCVIAAIAFLYYTQMLFDEPDYNNFLIGLLLYCIYGIFIISSMLFCSTLANNNTISAVLGFAIFVIISIIGSIPALSAYSPSELHSLAILIISGQKTTADSINTIATTLSLSILFTIGAIMLFDRQEL